MQYIDFSKGEYNLAILVKTQAFNMKEIQENYLDPLNALGFEPDKAIAFPVPYEGKKAVKTLQKEFLDELMPMLHGQGIKYLLVNDGEYFKTLTKLTKSEPYYGEVIECKYPGFEDMHIILGVNHKMFFYNPDMRKRLDQSLRGLTDHSKGCYQKQGTNVLKSEFYPDTLAQIEAALDSLHLYPSVTADIEAFSLKHYDSGIGTIGFATDQHSGFAFCVDYQEIEPEEQDVWCTKDNKFKKKMVYGKQVLNPEVRSLLKNFFLTYKGNIKWHNISYDVYILIYQLFMDDLLDQEGLLAGLEVMLANWDCTKLITYLATNTCAGNKLSLKDQTQEFLGAYAQDDITNICLIPKPDLLKYNLSDCAGTWYTYNKRWDTLVEDDQLSVYEDLFKPSIFEIIQMQLTGMCLDMPRVLEVETILKAKEDEFLREINLSPYIADMLEATRHKKWEKDYQDRKKKAKNPDKIKPKDLSQIKVSFNPNSGDQLISLLYDHMKLPVVDLTDTKLPATGAKTLKKLIHLTDDQAEKDVLTALRNYSKVNKILTSFIPAFKAAPLAKDGYHYLFGSFNLGGTKSGRLSSSNP